MMARSITIRLVLFLPVIRLSGTRSSLCVFCFLSLNFSLCFSLLTIQCLLFLQHSNSYHVGAVASPVAKEMVAGVTYV